MAFLEDKDPRIIGKDGKPKAPEHQRNALKNKYQGMLRKPFKTPTLLTLENLLEINVKLMFFFEVSGRLSLCWEKIKLLDMNACNLPAYIDCTDPV